MHNKLSHGIFSNNKALLSSTRTSYIIVKKGISIGMLLGYCYMRNNLVRLGGYPLTEILLICHISFIFILRLYIIKWNDALTEIYYYYYYYYYYCYHLYFKLVQNSKILIKANHPVDTAKFSMLLSAQKKM